MNLRGLTDPTDFYLMRQHFTHARYPANRQPTPTQVSATEILPILALPAADLLADRALADCLVYITPDQLRRAKKIANRYDVDLKELRRRRSEILERAGIDFESVQNELAEIRLQTWNLLIVVRDDIFQNALSFKQRTEIYEFFRDKAARARAAEAAHGDKHSEADSPGDGATN